MSAACPQGSGVTEAGVMICSAKVLICIYVQFQQPDYHLDRERSAAKFWKVGAVSGRLGVHSSTKGNTCLLKV